MKQVQRLVLRMSRSRFPVLILGETGTGKGLVAQAIHDLGGKGRFVVVDCSSMVGPLMESELFGHRKGSYTGAHVDKLGLLDEAHGGTAFFDEIGELPLDLQMKLLRVLHEKEFRAIGALATRSSNFRVIAATNQDLEKAVEEKRFRQDLYYRLNVMKLRMPALRERKEDIPALVAHFLQRHGHDHQVPDEVMALLCEWDWPGNVRELENTIQKMVAMNSGPYLSTADLPSMLINRRREREQGSRDVEEAAKIDGAETDAGIIPLDEIEKRAIIKALQYTKGDRTLASNALGIGRTTLYRKLKKYGM
jgi:transcriptional regulator with PAS, ATPase and Fis domain